MLERYMPARASFVADSRARGHILAGQPEAPEGILPGRGSFVRIESAPAFAFEMCHHALYSKRAKRTGQFFFISSELYSS
jgi:hypothetical protein